ncbi:MAG: hypothetical protein RRY72_08015 [Bacteroides sp.]
MKYLSFDLKWKLSGMIFLLSCLLGQAHTKQFIGIQELTFTSSLMKTKTYKDTVKISFHSKQITKKVSDYMIGFNMSYYHDKDDLWVGGKIANKLKEVKTSFLRYPGGAETSYFHWQYAGCPGYKDLWNPKHKIVKDEISDITENMDTDEFIYLCKQIGAEPLLGVNVLSGIVNNKLKESLQEVKNWMIYCKSKGYKVKYWYLDNEVNHWGSYTQISVEEYAKLINLYSETMKAINPDIKLIINWLGNPQQPAIQELIKLAGKSFDIIDLHFYYGWDIANWKTWLDQQPMADQYTNLTYTDLINSLSTYIRSSENPAIEIACLEWNIGPTKADTLSDYKQAMMQTEMFQQFLMSDLKMASVWPLIWNVEKGSFPSILNQKDYSTTPIFEIFKLYSVVLGKKIIASKTTDKRILPQCFTNNKSIWICALNKSENELPVRIEKIKSYSNVKIHIVSSDDINGNQCHVMTHDVKVEDNMISFIVPPSSFFRVDLE